MYAIIELGGRQWKVEPGTRLDVNRLPEAVGAQHVVERILLAKNGDSLQVGRPYVDGAKVICEVLEHRLGPKEISYHFRRRENWRKTVGHRQPLSRLVVKEITFHEAPVSRPAAETVVKAHTKAVGVGVKAALPAAARQQAGAPKKRVAKPSAKKAPVKKE